MQITYHELARKEVYDSTGRKIGRVTDLRAARVNDCLCIAGLLVGDVGLLVRIGLRRLAPMLAKVGVADYYVEWDLVAAVGRAVELRVPMAELRPIDDEE